MDHETKQVLLDALNHKEIFSHQIPEFPDPDAAEVFGAFQKAQRRLVANLLHNMRAPSHAVIALLQLLNESLIPGQLDAEQQQFLSMAMERVELNLDHLTQLQVWINPPSQD